MFTRWPPDFWCRTRHPITGGTGGWIAGRLWRRQPAFRRNAGYTDHRETREIWSHLSEKDQVY